MRIFMAAAIVALLTGSAHAQGLPPMKFPMGGDNPHAQPNPELEKDYKSTIDKVPNRKSNDPWGSVRSNPSTSSSKKSK